jgi:hypothetical protein
MRPVAGPGGGDELAWAFISFTVEGGRIAAIDVIRNPDKLTDVPEPR